MAGRINKKLNTKNKTKEYPRIIKEKWEELQKKGQDLRDERDKIERTTPKEFYKKDLKDLRKKI